MVFENFPLPAHLEKHLEAILYLKDFTPGHSIERIVPTGHIFLIFELDNIPRNTYDNQTLEPLQTFTKAWISGSHRNFISISAHPLSEMLVVQFRPAGSYPFLHRPARELNDRVVPAKDILGEEVLELRDQLILAGNPQAKFETVATWLSSRFDVKKEAPEYLLQFTAQLRNEPVSNLKNIIGSYPYTQKQLIEHFKRYVGLTPKYYQRILRFHEILKKVHEKEKVSWADVAYSCDYADQSHFIKEFYLFSGFSPLEFLKMEFEKGQTNFFPLDKKG